jgi:Mrp family chromosome partitioning ATPase
MIQEWQRPVEQIVLAAPVAGARVLAVVAPGSGAGVSSFCRAAAAVFAKAGGRVLVVDFSRPAGPAGDGGLIGAAQATGEGYDLATADAGHEKAGLFNNSDWLRRTLADDQAGYTTVLLDLPPLLEGGAGRMNPLAAAAAADAVLLVCAAGASAPATVERASDLLASAGAPLVGAVFNDGPQAGGRRGR